MALDFAVYLRGLGDKTNFRLNAKTYLRDGWGKSPAFKGLLATVDGRPAGYILYHFGYDTDRAFKIMYMADLYVREEYRRSGVGQALVERALEICRKAGAKRLFWSVYAHNLNARGFYRHIGARYTKDTFYMYLGVR